MDSMEFKKFYEVIVTASLEDLEVISSAVQDRRDQLVTSLENKAKRLRARLTSATGHGQAIVERLIGVSLNMLE